MVKVKFIDVGAHNASWSIDMHLPTETTAPVILEEFIADAVRRKGVLMSRTIEAHIDDTGSAGSIVVGMVRTVGRFEIHEAG